MSTKKYCFIPEDHKEISVFNPGSITDLHQITRPDVAFRHYIDSYDRVKLFYIGDKTDIDNIKLENEYLKYHILRSIKSIFKVTELDELEIIESDESCIKFSLWFDIEGNHIEKTKLISKNKYDTVLKHRYIFNFFKRYEKTED
jgi:hypothetical protein